MEENQARVLQTRLFGDTQEIDTGGKSAKSFTGRCPQACNMNLMENTI